MNHDEPFLRKLRIFNWTFMKNRGYVRQIKTKKLTLCDNV